MEAILVSAAERDFVRIRSDGRAAGAVDRRRREASDAQSRRRPSLAGARAGAPVIRRVPGSHGLKISGRITHEAHPDHRSGRRRGRIDPTADADAIPASPIRSEADFRRRSAGEDVVMADLGDLERIRAGGRRGRRDRSSRRLCGRGSDGTRSIRPISSASTISSRRRGSKASSAIVFASTNHVVGFYRRDQTIGDDVTVRPDTRYGLSKAFGEAVGSLYADKYGAEVMSIRIGNVAERPSDMRRLSIWISPRDFVQLATIGLGASRHPP